MDSNTASGPGLLSSLEAMIEASVSSLLNRRLGSAADTLDAQIQAAVTAALDRRLGLAVGSLGNRMTSLIDQRLGGAVNTLNHRVNASVTAALEQRLGPPGGAVTAQITFMAAPLAALPSLPSSKAQVLSEVDGVKENRGACRPEEELVNAQLMRDGRSTEKEQPTEKHETTDSEAPTTTPDLGDGLSANTATSEKSNEITRNETDIASSGIPKGAVYPLFTDSTSESKADTTAILTVKSNATTQEPSSSADKALPKRKANQKDEAKKADDTDESEPSSEGENNVEKPKRKRSKVKLDPPGYTNGPSIKFRRVSPKLTACAKSRGYPRVIDLKSFTEASNKQNLTMADVVATVLFNYDPLSLHAFMDLDMYPRFRFVRKEHDRKAKDFVIERHRESFGIVVKVRGVWLH